MEILDSESLRFLGQLIIILFAVGTILMRMGRIVQKFETLIEGQASELQQLEQRIDSLASVFTAVAVQKVELAQMRTDITRLENRYDELRRGRGFIREDN